MYVPVLKWRQGEYLALRRLHPEIKDATMPLLEIPPIEWDFAKGMIAKTIDQHLEPFARRLNSNWGQRAAYIDFNLLDPAYRLLNGIHPMTFIFDELRNLNTNGIPVTSPYRDSEYQEAVKHAIKQDGKGVCFRISFNDLVRSNILSEVSALALQLEVGFENIDFILDLGSPNYDPIATFAAALKSAISKISNITAYRSFTLISSAFPKSMGEVNKGGQVVPRSEWELYKEYCKIVKSGEVFPQFGDYAIAHPILPQQDMRLLKPAASLRYTIDNAWLIEKGVSVRDNGFEQYREICEAIVNSGYFENTSFSEADEYIKNCSDGTGSTGNLTTWRWVGTNHHITKVVTDLSNSGVV